MAKFAIRSVNECFWYRYYPVLLAACSNHLQFKRFTHQIFLVMRMTKHLAGLKIRSFNGWMNILVGSTAIWHIRVNWAS